MSFNELLKSQLIEESRNYYSDNYDYYAHPKKKPVIKKVINVGKRVLFTPFFFRLFFRSDYVFQKVFLRMYGIDKYLDDLDFFYNALQDDNSKKLLLKIAAFRVLGYVKVKLPLSSPQYWTNYFDLEALSSKDDFISPEKSTTKLFRHDLAKLNFPVSIYMSSKGLYATFCIEQYKLALANGNFIAAKKDDVVFDLGGCFGDTALYFAHNVGNLGKVYAFEFIPGNIKVIRKNMELNPQLSDQISIVDRPVWESSNTEVYFKENGPASKISFQEFENFDGKTKTITIDDFVKINNISKLDFLKTDIEGAEPYALKGAVDTLKKFRPKLAISIYHSMDDFVNIVKQIDDLHLGYQFYLGHATIFASETVLFCSVDPENK